MWAMLLTETRLAADCGAAEVTIQTELTDVYRDALDCRQSTMSAQQCLKH